MRTVNRMPERDRMRPSSATMASAGHPSSPSSAAFRASRPWRREAPRESATRTGAASKRVAATSAAPTVPDRVEETSTATTSSPSSAASANPSSSAAGDGWLVVGSVSALVSISWKRVAEMSIPSRKVRSPSTSDIGTTWMPWARTISSERSQAESVTTAIGRRASWMCPPARPIVSCWTFMSSALCVTSVPSPRRYANTSSGSSVWTWILSTSSERIAMTESPSRLSTSRTSSCGGRSGPRTSASVQNRYCSSSTAGYSTSAGAAGSDAPGPAPTSTGTPCTKRRTPSSRLTKPLAPASTTPAFLRTGSCSGVRESENRARSTTCVTSGTKSPASDSLAATAASRMTVRIVPSTGFSRARYRRSTPA